MFITLENAVISRVRGGKSKKGNDYAIIKLIFDYEQYELFCTGNEVDVANLLPTRKPINLLCELMPNDINGGVRLSVVNATDEDGVYYGPRI